MKKRKILLIDDDDDMHVMINHVLSRAGYVIESAYSGEEGLQKLVDSGPDLVILDYMMPQKNGEQIFKEFMTSPEFEGYRNTPFVMLTARQTKEEKIGELLEEGMTAFLYKPFGQKELINVIQNILTTHQIQLQKQNLFNAINEAKDFLSNLVDSIPDALFIINSDGIVTFYNGGHKEVLGYENANIINKPFENLLDPQSISFGQIIEMLDQEENLNNYELNLLNTERKPVPFRISIAPLLNESDKRIGIIFAGSDISEIKQLEKKLIEKEKLAMLFETAVAVNHEINNPLSPILGNLQMLLANKDRFDEQTCQRLESIQRNAIRIKNITYKLRQIKQPVQKEYMGDTKMLDIHKSS